MPSLIVSFIGTRLEEVAGRSAVRDGSKLSISDIEAQFRSLTESASEKLSRSKSTGAAVAAVGGVLVVAAAFLQGRRRGRKRATVLEIRRI